MWHYMYAQKLSIISRSSNIIEFNMNIFSYIRAWKLNSAWMYFGVYEQKAHISLDRGNCRDPRWK